MITFLLPVALLLILAAPVFLLLAHRAARWMPLPRAGAMSARRSTFVVALLPELFRAGAIAALALAVAGPVTQGAAIEQPREGIPIILAIDISSSMLAQDFTPRDRLAVAKSTIADFVGRRANDPIGLVALAAEALTLVPATTNHTVVLSALESLRVGLLEDGTAVGDGLATAVNRLRRPGNADGVVILLSDGENNRGTIDPLAAADAAAALGVPVYTIGVGSEGVAQVPVGSAPEGFRYAELPVGLDEELLRTIAERTGGAYFRATDPAALQRIYAEIDQLVPSVIQTDRFVQNVHWAPLALLIAALFLLLEWAFRASRWGAFP